MSYSKEDLESLAEIPELHRVIILCVDSLTDAITDHTKAVQAFHGDFRRAHGLDLSDQDVEMYERKTGPRPWPNS